MDMHLDFSKQTNSTPSKGALHHHMQPVNMQLPSSFIPTKTNVICGRASNHHSGNDWCRQLVAVELCKYHQMGLSRKDKTELVTSVVAQVRAQNPHGGGFVKKEASTGRWLQISDGQARRKVLEMLQDALSTKQEQRFHNDTTRKNKSFLDEYVSKQTAALKEPEDMVLPKSKRPHPAEDDMARNKRQRNRGREGNTRERNDEYLRWPRLAGLKQIPEEQPDDVTLSSFLHHLANSIPDSLVTTSNPFEPDPLPIESHN